MLRLSLTLRSSMGIVAQFLFTIVRIGHPFQIYLSANFVGLVCLICATRVSYLRSRSCAPDFLKFSN